MHLRIAAGLITFVVGAALGATAAPAKTTLTGKVGDAMCGVAHMVKGEDAKCTRVCVKGGAEYALIVKDKAYRLKADERLKSQLDKLADRKVTITGTRNGDAIDVVSIEAVK